ncbi:Tetratricopeptide repeat-containing protein [Salinimicrobium catena]|uniref:Tetratricopeptide repeat-containing protein n=1 Tax=Salinimicrobium catena TaxID=390640 RepID=A0A1H5MPF1_9FLAO|nr:tetratricopeptide repeat protein [Salinimicrobium catena]SDL27277.1 Tetratricopeptide repeat-containing protein [Salinimicrobium catena]SEE91262.1 Tetratricopeptide repeat-containing protein [Salinimicrobium catena]
MATYKKRGYKPNTKEEEQNTVEDQSTTAEVFNTLDEGASKTEEWVARNQKYIFIIIGLAAAVILGYLAYEEFIQEPKEAEAANEMFQAQQYFDQALETQNDSLYNLALTGGQGKFGFEDIIENYGGTKAGNLAHYYAGMAYLNTNQYQKAIDNLDEFESDDEIIAPLAKGGIGDAFMQLDQPEDALGYYEEAANMRTNSFTTPKFLLKAAVVAIQLGDGDAAVEYLNRIKNEFPESAEANKVAVYLGQAKAMQ